MPGGNISVIGPRMSGKTTYLAALAYHKTYLASHQKGLKYTITAQNPEARQLQKEAEEVLLAGSHFRANKVEEKSVFEYPFYAFSIEYQSHRFASPQKIELTTRDYPGEVFEKLEKSTSLGSKHEEFGPTQWILTRGNRTGLLAILIQSKYMKMVQNIWRCIVDGYIKTRYPNICWSCQDLR